MQHPAYKVGELGYMPACSTFGHDFEMDYPGTYTITIRAVEEQYAHWQPLVKRVNIQPSTEVAGIHACFHVSHTVFSVVKSGCWMHMVLLLVATVVSDAVAAFQECCDTHEPACCLFMVACSDEWVCSLLMSCLYFFQ